MAYLRLLCLLSCGLAAWGKLSPGEQPLPAMAEHGEKAFKEIADATANSEPHAPEP